MPEAGLIKTILAKEAPTYGVGLSEPTRANLSLT